jgi:hypothetical protein
MKTRAILAALLLTLVLAAPREAHDSAASLADRAPLGAPRTLVCATASVCQSDRQADGVGVRQSGDNQPSRFLADVAVRRQSATTKPSPALIGGTLSYVDPSYGPLYLALPFPRGTVAMVCGPADCVLRRSTDFGPDQRVHPDRIADLSASDFEIVCGFTPAERIAAGLCAGTVELEPPVDPADDRMRVEDGGPAFTLPPTDTRSQP